MTDTTVMHRGGAAAWSERAVLDSLVDAVVATDLDGIVILWNAAAERLFGRPRSDALGRFVAEVVPLPGTPEQGAAVQARVRAGEAVSERVTLPVGGVARAIQLTLGLLSGEDGAAAGVVATFADATVAAAAEAALRDSEAMFRRRFTDAPVPQAVLDLDGRLLDVNPALCAMLETTPEQLLVAGSIPRHPDDVAAAEHALADLLAGRVEQSVAPRRYLTSAGKVRSATTWVMLVRDADGAPRNVAMFLQDVTAEHAARAAEADAVERLARSERRFRALVHGSADVALVCDRDRRLTYVSPAISEMFGHVPERLLGRAMDELVGAADVAAATSALDRELTFPGTQPPFAIRLRAADGRLVPVEVAVTNAVADPAVEGLILNLRDVTAREALAATERRFREIVETADEGIWAVDEHGCTTFANSRLGQMLGVPVERLLDQPAHRYVHPDELPRITGHARSARHGETTRFETRLRRADGQLVWALVSMQPTLDAQGSYLGAHAMLTDISDLKGLEQQLRHNALHDELTGLANRTLLADRLEAMLARHERHGGLGAVLFIDVDEFKLVNDTLGHGAGDTLIVEVASRIAAAVRAQDTVARFGGDEFVVVADDLADPAEALEIGSRVLAAIVAPLEIAGHRTAVSASIGVACTPADAADALLRDADSAMYLAKNRGRGRIEVFDPDAQESARREMVLANDLRAALATASELVLHYQPVCTLPGGVAVSAEALVRWEHPVRGLLSPDAFVPLAERFGLAIDLDRAVLGMACRQAAAWIGSAAVPADFAVAVNLSAAHLAHPDLVGHVEQALVAAGLPARLLTVEVTETSLIADCAAAVSALQALREVGVCVALDDFGTGYSSLSYVKTVPADSVKIDRSFVAGLGRDDEDDVIVATILGLADSLALRCVAEGVERPDQLARLARLGCGYGQGYLWSPPVPAEELPALVATAAVGSPPAA